ncbi:type II secretion system F family protein [Alkalilimnicola ehrlichii]|nr:type II secretion system F family protein [Alkalilimnicola ehrlichii]
MARHLELDQDNRQQVKTALRYPLLVLFAIAVAMVVINIFVIPAFSSVFSGFNVDLPLPTRVLLAVSGFMVDYGLLLAALLALGGVGGACYLRTEAGAYRWDRLKLRLPIAGSLIRRATLGRFARSAAMALRSGVPLLQALTLVARAVDNRYVEAHILGMRSGVERGETLTRTAQGTGMFTPLVVQMLSVGEETGQVDDMLEQVAEFYEREVEHDLKRLNTYIEPVLIGAIGGMVLVLALGVFLPMWDLASAARGG